MEPDGGKEPTPYLRGFTSVASPHAGTFPGSQVTLCCKWKPSVNCTQGNLGSDSLFGVQGNKHSEDPAMAFSATDFADRWRALAKEALDVASEMTDPEAEEQMWKIALWYEQLAKHADTRKSTEAPRNARTLYRTVQDDIWHTFIP